MVIKIEKLAKEAIELKRRYDMLAAVISDLDVFMREAVMVMIDIINTLHSTLDDLEERIDIIEAVVLGEEPIDVLRKRAKEAKREEAIISKEVPLEGPKPPPSPPPTPAPPVSSQQAVPPSVSQASAPSTPSAPAPTPAPAPPVSSQQAVPPSVSQASAPSPPSAPAPQTAPSAQTPGPGVQPSTGPQQAPRAPALPARMQLIFELRRALEERRKKRR